MTANRRMTVWLRLASDSDKQHRSFLSKVANTFRAVEKIGPLFKAELFGSLSKRCQTSLSKRCQTSFTDSIALATL